MKYPYQNFYEVLASHTARKPRRPAIFIGDDKLTYDRLLKKIDTLAHFLNSMRLKRVIVLLFFYKIVKSL